MAERTTGSLTISGANMARELIEIDDGKTKFDAYYDPNYKIKCIVCGAKPTVRIRRAENNKVFYEGEMCGPCIWGEADCIDPNNW